MTLHCLNMTISDDSSRHIKSPTIHLDDFSKFQHITDFCHNDTLLQDPTTSIHQVPTVFILILRSTLQIETHENLSPALQINVLASNVAFCNHGVCYSANYFGVKCCAGKVRVRRSCLVRRQVRQQLYLQTHSVTGRGPWHCLYRWLFIVIFQGYVA